MTTLAKILHVLIALNLLALIASIVVPVWLAATVITPSLFLGATFAFCGASLIVAYVVAAVILS